MSAFSSCFKSLVNDLWRVLWYSLIPHKARFIESLLIIVQTALSCLTSACRLVCESKWKSRHSYGHFYISHANHIHLKTQSHSSLLKLKWQCFVVTSTCQQTLQVTITSGHTACFFFRCGVIIRCECFHLNKNISSKF